MRSLRIVRKTANTAVVEKVTYDGKWVPATDEIPMREAMAFNVRYREDFKVWKVGQTLERKNAKRHLAQVIYAPEEIDAITYFGTTVTKRFPEGMLELCTGDWKPIAVRPAGDTNIYLRKGVQ